MFPNDPANNGWMQVHLNYSQALSNAWKQCFWRTNSSDYFMSFRERVFDYIALAGASINDPRFLSLGNDAKTFCLIYVPISFRNRTFNFIADRHATNRAPFFQFTPQFPRAEKFNKHTKCFAQNVER